jgi:AcrR family transcriptional regulator
MKTKEKILQRALELFNSDGVENVTTRHVAKSLGISQGNLHYHYPNKNTLIQALFARFIVKVKDAEQFKDASFQKKMFVDSVHRNYRIMEEFSFLFIDNEIIWRRIPQIKTDLIEFLKSKRGKFIELLNLYKANRIIRKNLNPTQINFLADQFIFTFSSWQRASEYMCHNDDKFNYFSDFTVRLILPYVVDSELKDWESLLVNK